MRLIDADELKTAFPCGENVRTESVRATIDHAPTIDPAAQSESCEYCEADADDFVTPLEKNCHAFVRFGANGWELSLKANGWHGSAKIRYCPMCGRDLYVKRGLK